MLFHIEYLADHPEFSDACAAWSYGRWGVQNKDSSLEQSLEKFRAGSITESIPLTVIALNADTNLPVAMGSIWEDDGDMWPDVSPWIASVYTLYRYREMGIASRIIKRLEKEARRLGYQDIFLKSGSAADFYLKRGYSAIETLKTNQTAAGQETLFKKALS